MTRDGQKHTFTAVGNPKMVRGKSSQMTAETIWFEMDPEKDDLKTAHGDEHVVIDDEDEQNGHIHATGDHVTYDQPSEVMTLTGHVRASQQLEGPVAAAHPFRRTARCTTARQRPGASAMRPASVSRSCTRSLRSRRMGTAPAAPAAPGAGGARSK